MDVSMVKSIENAVITGKQYNSVLMKRDSPSEYSKQEEPVGNDSLKKIAESVQEQINIINSSLTFQVYGKDNDRLAIVVSNKETGKIIREIPSEEAQKMQTKLDELIGMIFNGVA